MKLALPVMPKKHHSKSSLNALDCETVPSSFSEVIMQRISALFATLILASGVANLASAAEPTTGGCVDVTVGQFRTPDYKCLSQQMGSSQGDTANRKNREAMNPTVDKIAPNKLGLFNQSATRNRMGSNFGTSVTPQRPAPVVLPGLPGR